MKPRASISSRPLPWALSFLMAGRLALLGVMVLAVTGCEFGGGTTGGSETTNGLTGILEDGQGKPIARAAVALVPETYNPIPGKDARPLKRTSTDARGRYRFSEVASGTYNLEAKDTARHMQLLVRGIRIDSAAVATLADATLQTPGTLEIPFADRHLPENAQAYVPGTTYWTYTASKIVKESLTLENLAPGAYPTLQAIAPDLADGGPVSLCGPFRIAADSVTRLDALQAWLHAAPIGWDPAAAGLPAPSAGTAPADLRGYPLLVRLSRLATPSFEFSAAKSGGEDLRFTRPDGSPLPHQIEAWDVAAKTAAIWVRLDSLPLRPADTLLVMRWGRIDAVDASRGEAVFDGAGGFASVWHLGDAPNTVTDGYRDASIGANPATASGLDPDSRVAGPVGSGKRFAPAGGTLAATLPASLGGNGSFTVTFWMRFAATPGRAGLLTFGHPVQNRGFHFLIRADTTAQFGPWDVPADSNDTPSAQQNHFDLAPYLGEWAHVATVYDAAKGTLSTSIDGVPAAVNTLPALDIAPGSRVDIGKAIGMINLPQNDYGGDLDELRIYSRAVPEAWIRFDYATQKEGAAILRFP